MFFLTQHWPQHNLQYHEYESWYQKKCVDVQLALKLVAKKLRILLRKSAEAVLKLLQSQILAAGESQLWLVR